MKARPRIPLTDCLTATPRKPLKMDDKNVKRRAYMESIREQRYEDRCEQNYERWHCHSED